MPDYQIKKVATDRFSISKSFAGNGSRLAQNPRPPQKLNRDSLRLALPPPLRTVDMSNTHPDESSQEKSFEERTMELPDVINGSPAAEAKGAQRPDYLKLLERIPQNLKSLSPVQVKLLNRSGEGIPSRIKPRQLRKPSHRFLTDDNSKNADNAARTEVLPHYLSDIQARDKSACLQNKMKYDRFQHQQFLEKIEKIISELPYKRSLSSGSSSFSDGARGGTFSKRTTNLRAAEDRAAVLTAENLMLARSTVAKMQIFQNPEYSKRPSCFLKNLRYQNQSPAPGLDDEINVIEGSRAKIFPSSPRQPSPRKAKKKLTARSLIEEEDEAEHSYTSAELVQVTSVSDKSSFDEWPQKQRDQPKIMQTIE